MLLGEKGINKEGEVAVDGVAVAPKVNVGGGSGSVANVDGVVVAVVAAEAGGVVNRGDKAECVCAVAVSLRGDTGAVVGGVWDRGGWLLFKGGTISVQHINKISKRVHTYF